MLVNKVIKLLINLICELIILALCKDCVSRSTNMRQAGHFRIHKLLLGKISPQTISKPILVVALLIITRLRNKTK